MRFWNKEPVEDAEAGPDTQQLVERLKAGDTTALAALYDRYSSRVYSFLLRAVDPQSAEELLQDIFLALWNKSHLYDPARGSFTAWFFTLARHRLYDALPRYQKHVSLAGVELDEAAGADSSSDFNLEDNILQLFRNKEIQKAISHLPPDQRQIILLTYFGGFSQKEISARLNVPLSTVKGRARLGLQKLRTLLPE